MKQLLLLFVLTFVCCTPPPKKINGVLVEVAPCDNNDRHFWLHFPHEINDDIFSKQNCVDGISYVGYLDKYSIAVEVDRAYEPTKVVTELIEVERKLHTK